MTTEELQREIETLQAEVYQDLYIIRIWGMFYIESVWSKLDKVKKEAARILKQDLHWKWVVCYEHWEGRLSKYDKQPTVIIVRRVLDYPLLRPGEEYTPQESAE
jgi:hypothetical protein